MLGIRTEQCKIYLILLMVIATFGNATAQYHISNSRNDLHLGIAAKLNLELQTRTNRPNIHLSITSGLGYKVPAINTFPSLHAGLILFNTDAMGSSLNDNYLKIDVHYFLSGQLTVQLDKRDFNYRERLLPLYHFSDFTSNPLQNPFKSSLSLGHIAVFHKKQLLQRLGFFNANVIGRAQISYYNDGGPVLGLIGDGLDRYYTGGLILSYHGDVKTYLDLIEVSYLKFTGYQPHAFGLATELQMDYVVYADKEQFSYNQQRWKINASNLSTGYSLNIALYDINSIDLQDFLHFNNDVPYHPDYYNKWRFALGGRYEIGYLKF